MINIYCEVEQGEKSRHNKKDDVEKERKGKVSNPKEAKAAVKLHTVSLGAAAKAMARK